MDGKTGLLLLVVTLAISSSALPSESLNSTATAESDAAIELKAEPKEVITSSANLTGSSNDTAVKPAVAEEEDELKPPTREGGPENSEDDAQIDGKGRCGGGGFGGLGPGIAGIVGLTNALGALGLILGGLNNAIPGLNNGGGGLNDGTGGLNNGAGRLNNGAGRFNNGVGRWNGGGGLGFYPFLG